MADEGYAAVVDEIANGVDAHSAKGGHTIAREGESAFGPFHASEWRKVCGTPHEKELKQVAEAEADKELDCLGSDMPA